MNFVAEGYWSALIPSLGVSLPDRPHAAVVANIAALDPLHRSRRELRRLLRFTELAPKTFDCLAAVGKLGEPRSNCRKIFVELLVE